MSLFSDMCHVNTTCHIQLQLFSVALFQSHGPLVVLMLILCILHSCTLHYSLAVNDIFMQFKRTCVSSKMVLASKLVLFSILVLTYL